MTKPILEKLAEEYGDRVEFMPVNADEAREIIEQYRVFGIPTVLMFRNEKEVGRVTGAQNEARYRTLFEAMVAGGEVKLPLTTLPIPITCVIIPCELVVAFRVSAYTVFPLAESVWRVNRSETFWFASIAP